MVFDVILPRSNVLNDIPTDFKKSHYLEGTPFTGFQ